MLNVKEQQELTGNYLGNLFQERFGKRPDGVYVSFSNTFMIIYVRNLLSPSEKVLLEQDQEQLVYQTREKFMLSLLPEIKSYIQVITGVKAA